MENHKKINTPPKFAIKFLLWFLREDLAEEVLGDLEEQFYFTLERESLAKAKRNYWIQVFNYLRPFAIKHLSTSTMGNIGLFKNYLKISWRNLLKQKLYSSINIGGLAIGLASFIMILVYVEHELTYDQFYNNSDQVYRIITRQKDNNFQGSNLFAVTPAPLAGILEEELPEVLKAASVSNHRYMLKGEGVSFWEEGLWADKNFFDVFGYPLYEGNPKEALAAPNSMVVSETLSKKLFGYEDPMGKSVTIDFYGTDLVCTVTGLMPDVPAKSSMKYHFIASVTSRENYIEAVENNLWNNYSFLTFLKMEKGADPLALQQKMKEVGIPHRYEEGEPYNEFFVNALHNIHLQPNINFDVRFKGDKTYIYFYSVLAFLILALACINYMNLAIARSINRAREVGLRKVVGAFRRQIIFQFLSEAVLIAFIAFVLSIALVRLILPIFGDLIERPLSLDIFTNASMLLGILALIILVGVFSGSYPAFFMSVMRPVKVLKGKVNTKARGSRLQKALVIAQYTVSICLLLSFLIVYQQMDYIQSKELGYSREQIINVPVKDRSLTEKVEVITNEWKKNPSILSVARSNDLPVYIGSSKYVDDWDGNQNEDGFRIYSSEIDVNYLNLFEIELVAGRNFSLAHKSDADVGVILNESAVKMMGWSVEEAIGKEFLREGNPKDVVIGVVKDFHMHALYSDISPLMFKLFDPTWPGTLSVKVRPDSLQQTIAFLESKVAPLSDYPFEYSFLDDQFDQLYKSDLKLGDTFAFFTILAIMIASLGLFGLAAFSASRRTKEIGIRKVLGASPFIIFSLLAKQFLRLIVIAFAISVPLAWYGMETWLQNFAFRIEIEWWLFMLTGLVVFIIAYLTIGYQSLKAALINPVNQLRSE